MVLSVLCLSHAHLRQVAVMATVPVAGDGVALLYCAIVLLALTWVTFFLRAGVRIWRKAWGMDDYLMLLGIVSL